MRININFASREYVQARKLYLALCLFIAAAAAVFIGNYTDYNDSSAKAGILSKQVIIKQEKARQAEMRLAGFKRAVSPEVVKGAMREADFANAAIRKRAFSWTSFLNRLEQAVPEGVGITSIRPSFSSLDVDISGNALDVDRLAEFIDRLTSSKYFEDIPPLVHATEVVADKDVGQTLQVFNLKIKYFPDGRVQAAPTKAAGR